MERVLLEVSRKLENAAQRRRRSHYLAALLDQGRKRLAGLGKKTEPPRKTLVSAANWGTFDDSITAE